jgi:hypothetical protein
LECQHQGKLLVGWNLPNLSILETAHQHI